MTQEEKAKAYDEALEKARQFSEHPLQEDSANIVEYIFPELKESEDERIRKELIDFFSDKDESDYEGLHPRTEIVAWLEKQDGQKPVNDTDEDIVEVVKDTSVLDMVESKFKVGDAIIKKHNSDINKFGRFTITDITGGKYWYNDRIICDISEQYEWELVEQKPAWSEEDTSLCVRIQGILSVCKSHSLLSPDLCKEMCDWLKSLKERIGG